jgi:thioesterase domain-containing protein
MARALRQRGRTLRIVALLDTFPPMLMPSRDTNSPRDVVRSASMELSIELPLDALTELPQERWADRVWDALVQQRPVAAQQLGRAQMERLFRVQLVTMNAVARYRPGPLDGDATLFSARGLQAPRDEQEAHEVYARQAAQVASWRERYPELEHIDVPGYHISMMQRPEVKDLADLLFERITGNDGGSPR